jgi:hypothetical protein
MPCTGSNTYERYRAWCNLPTLLGLVLQSPTILATSVSVAQHSMANELHALVHAANCLALAQQAAANRVLPCGSAFLHPETADHAASMLSCFAKVATTVMAHRRCVVDVEGDRWALTEATERGWLTAPLARVCFNVQERPRGRAGVQAAAAGAAGVPRPHAAVSPQPRRVGAGHPHAVRARAEPGSAVRGAVEWVVSLARLSGRCRSAKGRLDVAWRAGAGLRVSARAVDEGGRGR